MAEPTRDEQVEKLLAELAALRAENETLRQRIAELERRLNLSSRNSSLPPSSDRPGDKAVARTSRAERRAEERRAGKESRRRGKQPGAEGEHLARRVEPDEVVVHDVEVCDACGADVTSCPIEAVEVRQVLDIPVPTISCVEHRVRKRRCSCGALARGAFPLEARAPACYGANLRAVACYLLHAQHLPIERTRQAMAEMYGIEVSTGFLAGLALEAAGGLSGFVQALKARLLGSRLVHVDETSTQVGTATWWLHVVSSSDATYLFADRTRGKDAPDAAGVLASFTGTMVHDRLSMYFGYDKATHAICGAHLVRNLASVAHRPSQVWAVRMRRLLLETNAAAHEARASGRRRLKRRDLEAFLSAYDALVADGLAANRPLLSRDRNALERESYNLACALRDLRAEATRFAVDLDVPFTNNEAERSLRMAKLHQKISGCFQSEGHARAFAVLRSYLDTARKHGLGALAVLGLVFTGHPWQPAIS